MLFSAVGDFFFQTKKLHNVFFIVGDEKARIGAVRELLINQSQVWWAMLSEDSDMVEKNDIHLPDIQPDIFMLLLKHCYGGLNELSKVATDSVISLCYCADKYLMATLIEKIATRLEPSTVDELFPALHCLALYNLRGVESGVQKLVQRETNEILAHPQFLECHEESVTFITRQEPLQCYEVELWDAVVKWAKHRAQNEERRELRRLMMGPLQYIRLLTLSHSNLCQRVFIQNIIDSNEISSICKMDLNYMAHLCSSFDVRLQHRNLSFFTVSVTNRTDDEGFNLCRDSCSALIVKEKGIQLKSVTFRDGNVFQNFRYYKQSFFSQPTSTVDIAVKITLVTNLLSNTSVDEPVIFKFEDFKYPTFDKFSVPTIVNSRGVELKEHSKYKIEVTFSKNCIASWNQPNCSEGHEFDHGTFFCSFAYSDGIGLSPCHILQFEYGV